MLLLHIALPLPRKLDKQLVVDFRQWGKVYTVSALGSQFI